MVVSPSADVQEYQSLIIVYQPPHDLRLAYIRERMISNSQPYYDHYTVLEIEISVIFLIL